MAALPYMQLYVADYLADTAHLTTEEHGAYLLLLFSYWQTGKPLRADRVASIARLSNERWTDVERTLKDFFHVKGGYWTHFRVESDLEKVASKSKKSSDAGKSSAKARAIAKQLLSEHQEGDDSTDVPTDVATDVQRTYQRNVNHTRSGDTDTDTDTETNTDQDQPQKIKATKKPKSAAKPKSDFALPDWISQSAWDSFVGMRKEIKKPLTENAKGLAVKALEKLALQGHNPDAVLNQSTLHSWQGIFPIKDQANDRFQKTNTGGSGQSRPSLVERVRQANAHNLRDDEPPAWASEPGAFDGEFERINEADGSLVGSDD